MGVLRLVPEIPVKFPLCRRTQKGACRSGRTCPRSDGNTKPRCYKPHLVNNMDDFLYGETEDDRSPFYHLVGSHRDRPDFRDRHGGGCDSGRGRRHAIAKRRSYRKPPRRKDIRHPIGRKRETGEQKGHHSSSGRKIPLGGVHPVTISGTLRIRPPLTALRSASTPRPTARHTARWSGTELSRTTPSKQRAFGPASAGTGKSKRSIGSGGN